MNISKSLDLVIEHFQSGNLKQAEHICKKILKKQPSNVDALHLLGVICFELGDHDLAINHINRALQIDPNFADAHNNLGNIYQKKKQIDEAIIHYKKALQLNPNLAQTYYNLGLVLQRKGEIDEVIECYKKALKLNLNFHGLHNNLGLILQNKGQLNEAIANYQKALHLNPKFAEACHNLGTAYKDKGQINEAENWVKRSIKIKPDDSTFYSTLLLIMNYNGSHDAETIYLEHLKFSKQYEESLAFSILPHTNEHDPSRKLKIGYVSPDFRMHSVAFFIEPVLISHNREHFEVVCYSNSLINDEVTQRIQEHTDQWRSIVRMSDEKVAELIRTDRIDILVDLSGHTAYNRILLFARKPAPIQISWIGYPATTGLSAIDYKIVDSYTDPPGMTDQFYTEKLIRMPENFLCYLPDKASPKVEPLPALSTGHITFGSFNNFAKVTSEVIKLWKRILLEIPESHLIIKSKSLSDRAILNDVMDLFMQSDIETGRIELLSWIPSIREHLSLYNRVDIGLDTFPYNGTTTTCEAMWMGVPVITLAGTTYNSRVGVSLLSNVGLPEMVNKTYDEYVSSAINLAKDLNRLQSLREHLRDMITCSPLCDAKRFTANLEMCYRQIWEKWCKTF